MYDDPFWPLFRQHGLSWPEGPELVAVLPQSL
jgi:hypothetical protein